MRPALLLPLAIGTATVLQATINRRIAGTWGIVAAALLNAVVSCGVAGLVWLVARAGAGPLDGGIVRGASVRDVRAWWAIPGVLGFVIVAGLPWTVARVGALQTFVAVVTAQMTMSLAWDYFVDDVPASAHRVVGALLAAAGAWLIASGNE